MKITIDREIFHQMMRGIAGKSFGPDVICNADRQKMFLLAERLAHATAVKVGGKVEVHIENGSHPTKGECGDLSVNLEG